MTMAVVRAPFGWAARPGASSSVRRMTQANNASEAKVHSQVSNPWGSGASGVNSQPANGG